MEGRKTTSRQEGRRQCDIYDPCAGRGRFHLGCGQCGVPEPPMYVGDRILGGECVRPVTYIGVGHARNALEGFVEGYVGVQHSYERINPHFSIRSSTAQREVKWVSGIFVCLLCRGKF